MTQPLTNLSNLATLVYSKHFDAGKNSPGVKQHNWVDPTPVSAVRVRVLRWFSQSPWSDGRWDSDRLGLRHPKKYVCEDIYPYG